MNNEPQNVIVSQFLRRWQVCLVFAAVTAPIPGALQVELRGAEARSGSSGKDTIVARIGSRQIRESEVPQILNELPALERPRVMDDFTLAALLRRYVTDEVLWANARASNPTGTAKLSRREAISEYLNSEVERWLQRDPPDVERYYRQHIKAFSDPDQAKVRVIQVPAKEKAERILQQLKQGEDFASLADRESQSVPDTGRGGLMAKLADAWGYVPGIGSFPAATDALFALQPGDITPHALERGGVWYVFKLEALIPRKNKTLDEMRHKVTEACMDARRKELKPLVVSAALKEAGAEVYLKPPAADGR